MNGKHPMPPMSAEEYRERAEESEKVAREASSQHVREVMLYVASWSRWNMKTATQLLAETVRMREFARTVTDPELLAELHELIEEWERRARGMGNGDATDDD